MLYNLWCMNFGTDSLWTEDLWEHLKGKCLYIFSNSEFSLFLFCNVLILHFTQKKNYCFINKCWVIRNNIFLGKKYWK